MCASTCASGPTSLPSSAASSDSFPLGNQPRPSKSHESSLPGCTQVTPISSTASERTQTWGGASHNDPAASIDLAVQRPCTTGVSAVVTATASNTRRSAADIPQKLGIPAFTGVGSSYHRGQAVSAVQSRIYEDILKVLNAIAFVSADGRCIMDWFYDHSGSHAHEWDSCPMRPGTALDDSSWKSFRALLQFPKGTKGICYACFEPTEGGTCFDHANNRQGSRDLECRRKDIIKPLLFLIWYDDVEVRRSLISQVYRCAEDLANGSIDKYVSWLVAKPNAIVSPQYPCMFNYFALIHVFGKARGLIS